MLTKRSWRAVLLNGLVIVLLLGLPVAAGAQTTGTTGTTTATPTNGITNPKDMAALSGTVEVQGFAESASFMKWQLDLLPNNNPNAPIFLALGTTPGAFTYSFDTSKLPAGEHALRLRVVRMDSNYDEFVTRFTIGAAAGGAAAGGTTAAADGATTTGTTTGASTAVAATSTPAAAATTGAGVTTNGFAAPREGQAISGQFVVRGFADDPNFMKWQLDLLPNANANAPIFLALGTTAGVFTHTLNTTNLPAGEHALRLRVVRSDSNYNEYTTKFTIGTPAAGGTPGAAAAGAPAAGGTTSATTAPAAGATTSGASATGQMTNGITAPAEGATVRGAVQITGYAQSADFMKWQLDLLPGGNASQAAFLAFGEEAGEFTHTLDTTNLPAGEHALRLRVVRSDSNYDEYITKFVIAK